MILILDAEDLGSILDQYFMFFRMNILRDYLTPTKHLTCPNCMPH
jgi:hypothetical protein